MPEKRAQRSYTEEQKRQLVELYNQGKPRSEIIREYVLTGSAFDRWVKRINATGSSHAKDNHTGGTGASTAAQREPAVGNGE